jgi:lactoylglutathione lyase
MAFKTLTPNLMVEDVSAAIAFYRDTLGFAVTGTMPAEGEGAPVWASLSANGVSLMFQARHSLEEELPQLTGQPISASQTLYIGVDDADTLYEGIRGNAHIIKEPQTTFYGAREFYIQDPSGYILGFSSSADATDAADDAGSAS